MSDQEQKLPAGDGLTVADYQAAFEDHQRMVRELDVLLNGDAAAKQASLCDIVAQVRKEGIRSLAAPRQPGEMGAGVPDGWKLVPIEPTADMMLAADETGFHGYNGAFHIIPDQAYKAMLAAAPRHAPGVSAASAHQDEREAFEAWLQPYWTRDKYMDPEGDLIYREAWVQGAWIAWQARGQQVQADAVAVAHKYVDELTNALGMGPNGLRNGKFVHFAWEYLVGMVEDMVAYYEREEKRAAMSREQSGGE